MTGATPYRAKSLAAAERMVNRQRKHIAQCDALLKAWADERVTLAKLAADSPQFYNPLHVAAAKRLRDSILSNRRG